MKFRVTGPPMKVADVTLWPSRRIDGEIEIDGFECGGVIPSKLVLVGEHCCCGLPIPRAVAERLATAAAAANGNINVSIKFRGANE